MSNPTPSTPSSPSPTAPLPPGTLVRLTGLPPGRRELSARYAIVTSFAESPTSKLSVHRLPYSDGDSPLSLPPHQLEPISPLSNPSILSRYSRAITARARELRYLQSDLILAETETLLNVVQLPPPQLAPLLVLRATALRAAGRDNEAIAIFHRVLAPPLSFFEPDTQADARTELCLTFAKVGRLAEALHLVDILHAARANITFATKHPHIHKAVERATEGVLMFATKSSQDAVLSRRAAERMLQVDENHFLSLNLLAGLLRASRRPEDRLRARQLKMRSEKFGELTPAMRGIRDDDLVTRARPNVDDERPPGMLVRLHGLTSERGLHLNGRFGVVAGQLTDHNRLPVKVLPAAEATRDGRRGGRNVGRGSVGGGGDGDDNGVLGPLCFVPGRLRPTDARELPVVGEYLRQIRILASTAEKERQTALAVAVLRTGLSAMASCTTNQGEVCTLRIMAARLLRDMCEGKEAAAFLRAALDSEGESGLRMAAIARDAHTLQTGRPLPNERVILRGEMASALAEGGEVDEAVDEVQKLVRDCSVGESGDEFDYREAYRRLAQGILTQAVMNDDKGKRRACDLLLELDPENPLAKETLADMEGLDRAAARMSLADEEAEVPVSDDEDGGDSVQ